MYSQGIDGSAPKPALVQNTDYIVIITIVHCLDLELLSPD